MLFKADKELYIISNGLKTWRFVNGSKSIIHDSYIYEPMVKKRSEFSDEYGDSKTLSTVMHFDSKNQSMDEIIKLLYADINVSSFSIEIIRVFSSKGQSIALFKGFGSSFEIKLEDMSLSIAWATAARNFSNPIYSTKFQRLCNNKIYDEGCGLSFDDWCIHCRVLSIEGRTINYELLNAFRYQSNTGQIEDPENPGQMIDPPPQINDFSVFDLGLFLFNKFYKNVKQVTSSQVILDGTVPFLKSGDIFYIAPSCDYSVLGKCSTLFNNGERAVVFPNVPSVNPVNNQFMK